MSADPTRIAEDGKTRGAGGTAPRADLAPLRMLQAIAAGEISGDDIVVHQQDGKLYEVFPDGRRRLLPG